MHSRGVQPRDERPRWFPYVTFQFMHSHGVQRRYGFSPDLSGGFQFMHSHGVQPTSYGKDLTGVNISIHALTWSATKDPDDYLNHLLISIHALTWSATIFMC